MLQKQLIKNSAGDELYTVIEGSEDVVHNVIFVHGNGVDMHGDYFDDVVPALNQAGFRTVRFDQRGSGQSGGKEEEGSLSTYAQDLEAVLQWTREEFRGEMDIIAHSMGCNVAAWLSPEGIRRSVFSGIPNPDPEFRVENFKKRILMRKGTIDEQGITLSPRRDGSIRKVGPQFWADLRNFDAVARTREYATKTELLIIRPLQDDVVPYNGMEKFKDMTEAQYIEVPGDHRFENLDERTALIARIKEFFGK